MRRHSCDWRYVNIVSCSQYPASAFVCDHPNIYGELFPLQKYSLLVEVEDSQCLVFRQQSQTYAPYSAKTACTRSFMKALLGMKEDGFVSDC